MTGQKTQAIAQLPGFSSGTLIQTAQGLLPASKVEVGMGLCLPGGGCATVMWRQVCKAPPPSGYAQGVTICKDAFAPGSPSADLLVSAHQRVVVADMRQSAPGQVPQAMLVPAAALLGRPGIRLASGQKAHAWVDLACGGHHLLEVQGCLTETLLADRRAQRRLPALEWLRMIACFTPWGSLDVALNGPPANPRRSLPGRMA